MTAKLNIRSALFLLLASFILASGCKDLELEIQDTKDRLDVLEGSPIASIEEQFTAINKSISDLKTMDESLSSYITALQTAATDLQKQIDAANAEIAKVESELEKEITDLGQSLLKELKIAKEATETELLAINTTLSELKTADEALDKKISALQTYVDTQLTSTASWANATFSTLTQYEQTQTDISAIKSSIEQVNAGLAALETRLAGKIATDIQTAIAGLRTDLTADYVAKIETAVNAVTQAYISAISKASDEITAAYTAAIAAAIKESEANLMAWVNEQLVKGYYDIAAIDGKLSALSTRLDETDTDLQKQLAEQQAALEASKEELTKAYKNAIKEAIEENNGVISASIAESVQNLETKINSRLSAIESQITAMQKGIDEIIDDIDTIQKQIESITTTLETLKNEDQELKSLIDKLKSDYAALLQELEEISPIDEISKKTIVDDITSLKTLVNAILNRLDKLENDFVNRIQSLKYIPEYSDGKEELEPVSRTVTLDFLVSPSNQALSIAEAWEIDTNVLTASLRYTKNPETRVSNMNIPLTVIDVNAISDGQLQVVLAEDVSSPLDVDFLAGIKNAVVYIKVSDGNSDCFSDLVELMCLDLSVYTDLSPLCENGIYETANSYIVSTSGLYKFKAYKGNSQELAGTAQTNHPSGKVSHVNVLWESFGTDVLPSKGDLIYSVGYKNEYVYFRVLDEFKEGNAVIAANDNLDRVLWSWHVWLTDYPKEQVYYNNAGTMMDRNLGATTDNPREPNVIGLKYQWGRKDPFGGGARTESTKTEKSMSIENAILNPMTYFQYSSNGTSGPLTTEILWNEDSNIKSIYDPCPAGWRVPNGGKDGVWAKALGQSASFKNEIYDSINRGVNFSSKLCDDLCVWYGEGSYWAADGTAKEYPSGFQISYQDIYPSGAGSHKVNANFVRCMKEQS